MHKFEHNLISKTFISIEWDAREHSQRNEEEEKKINFDFIIPAESIMIVWH